MFLLIAVVFLLPSGVKACGETLTEQRGILESPGYPDSYTTHTCTFVIRRPAGERITLAFDDFSVDGEQDTCIFDFVLLRDGDSATAPRINGLRCNQVGREEKSFQNNMYIEFHTDSSQTPFRFRLNYSSGVLEENFFLVTSSDGLIYRLEVETWSTISIPGLRLLGPVAVDFDPVQRRIYWTDERFHHVASSFLNGTDQTILQNLNQASKPRGLAVDSLSRLVFYTDEGNGIIAIMMMSGSLHRTVISTDLDRPLAIVLDTMNGVMFWTDIGQQAKIERANYDGSERTVLHTDFLLEPTALALDLNNSRIYWADASSDFVEFSRLDGKGRIRIYSFTGVTFFGMAYSNNYLYVTDWVGTGAAENGSHIRILRADGGGHGIAYNFHAALANDIHIQIQDAWERGPNGCGNNNGGCSHFCVPSPGNTAKCLCPDAPTDCVEDSASTTTSTSQPTTSSATTVAHVTSEPISVPIAGPAVLHTTGFQEMTLTCDPDSQKPFTSLTWNIQCVRKQGRVCVWLPRSPQDDGKVVTCSIYYEDGQWGVGSFTVHLYSANQTVSSPKEGFPTAVVAGAAASGGVFVIIVVVVVIAIIRRKRRSPRQPNRLEETGEEGSRANSYSGPGPLEQPITPSRSDLVGTVNMSSIYDEVGQLEDYNYSSLRTTVPGSCKPVAPPDDYIHPVFDLDRHCQA